MRISQGFSASLAAAAALAIFTGSCALAQSTASKMAGNGT